MKQASWMKYVCPIYLIVFQIAFIVLMGVFGNYNYEDVDKKEQVPYYYAMWQDVHTMMFIGFGFLMTFLKKYGYGSVGFNMLIAVYVTEWALLVRGWFDQGIGNSGQFKIGIPK
jgi:ammonium transporter Rh